MLLSPDELVYWQWGFVKINATIVNTWGVMAVLVLISGWIARSLKHGRRIPPAQNVLEIVVGFIRGQIRDLTRQNPDPYLAFIGTLYLFIAATNLLVVVPGFRAPTSSLSTTVALSLGVLFAVPVFTVSNRGVGAYFRKYIEPTPLMLPFHVIGEISRTIALAVRLFGNMMSGSLAGAILLSIMPLFFPVLLNVMGLIIGQVQAYIFAVLTTVYIASSARVQPEKTHSPDARGSFDEHLIVRTLLEEE